jgi:hypothetical protein
MMLESSSENSDRMIICDRQGREYRVQVDPDENSYFLAQLLYRNSEVGRLQCVFYPPDKWMIYSNSKPDVRSYKGDKSGVRPDLC